MTKQISKVCVCMVDECVECVWWMDGCVSVELVWWMSVVWFFFFMCSVRHQLEISHGTGNDVGPILYIL